MAKQRKPKSKIYFGAPAQEAIIEYNKSKNPVERSNIYEERIKAPFEKSLFIFTNYSRQKTSCCRMYPTGILLKKNLLPFGGELSDGIAEEAINNSYISTILLGEYNDHFKAVYLKSQNSTLNNIKIVNNIPKYLKQQQNTLKNLTLHSKTFLKNGSKKKMNIVDKRIKNYEILEDIEKTLLELQFSVLYSIRINQERLKNSIEFIEDEEPPFQNNGVNRQIFKLDKSKLIYLPVKSNVNGEIGVKDYIDHTEIKTIFVPPEYIELVNGIVNNKEDEDGNMINIPIQAILPTMI